MRTRRLFGGSLIRQPYFQGREYREVGDPAITDHIMHDTFWVGVWPGLTMTILEYVARQIKVFLDGGERDA